MFADPLLLLVLLAVPLLLAAYLWQLRRRRRTAVRFSDVALVRSAAGARRRWRRHVPIGLVLASLALLGVAAARPQVKAAVPVSDATVILALDVSGSMCATDVDPNRLSAAQAAVRAFVAKQDEDTKIGLVLFSGFASVAVAPTTSRDDLYAAIDGATTGRGTTIGAAILTSIDTISALDSSVAPSDRTGTGSATGDTSGSGGSSGDDPATPSPSPSASAPAGGGAVATAPEIVVLLTDGANTRGVTPEEAAAQAAARGVRVYPIGFGTTHPTQLVCTPSQVGLGGNSFGGFGGFGGGFGAGGRDSGGPQGGGRNFLVVDEPALQQVATTTGGEYFKAEDATQLSSVLGSLPQHVVVQTQEVDLSAWVTVVAAVLLLVGLGLSIRWSSPAG